jgi:excisionase family DNA binding protein
MNLPAPEDQPTLSVDEVSELLGFGRSAIYESVRRGAIPSLRLGRRIRIPTAKLREMLGMDRPAPRPPREPAAQPVPTDKLAELLAEVVARGIQLAKERGAL